MKAQQYSIHSWLIAICSTTILLTCCSTFVSAKRLATTELTYQHISGNTYRFRCSYYMLCHGMNAPPTLSMNAHSTICGVDLSYTLPRLDESGTEVTKHCPFVTSHCEGGMAYGVKKWDYQLDINIPGQCPDWRFSISDCCRDAGISTIQGGAAMYAEARLNNSIHDNSSAQFTVDPVFFICLNQDFHFNNGAVDPDGDSLVISLASCPTGA